MQLHAGMPVQYVGGPKDGEVIPLPIFAPGTPKEIDIYLPDSDVRNLDLRFFKRNAVRVGVYKLREPMDSAPYFEWVGQKA